MQGAQEEPFWGGRGCTLKAAAPRIPIPEGILLSPRAFHGPRFPASPSRDARRLGHCPFFFIFWKRKAEGIIKPLKPARTRAAGLPAKVTRVKKIKSRVSQHIKPETVPCHMPSIRPAPSPPSPEISHGSLLGQRWRPSPLAFFSSSSAAFLNSCSKELASSLKSPTSSQFFRNRVGVGV